MTETIRRRTLCAGLVATSAVALTACGSAGTFANKPRPATPINLTVYIDNHRVSVSPATVGAGPVQFIITNEATKNVTLNVVRGGNSVANTSPINPGATAQVQVDVRTGDYTISTGATIHSARLHIGPPRPSASSALLQP
jgi:hypothetical protein